MDKQSEISKNSSIEMDGFIRSRNKTLYKIYDLCSGPIKMENSEEYYDILKTRVLEVFREDPSFVFSVW